ncbi:hypothetical protein AAMO2058_000382600 [Amorphochlora amoebiformis]
MGETGAGAGASDDGIAGDSESKGPSFEELKLDMTPEAFGSAMGRMLSLKGKKAKRAVMEKIIFQLSRYEATDNDLDALCLPMIESLHAMNTSMVVRFISELIPYLAESATTNKFPEIITKVFWIIKTTKTDRINCIEIELEPMSIDEFQSYFCSRLCRVDWAPNALLPMTSIIRELPFDAEQHQMLLMKIEANVDSIDMMQIPAFVHKYLLLAAKVPHPEDILRNIMSLFEHRRPEGKQPRAERKHLRQIQGTVLLHFDFTVKHHQELGNTLLKQMKERDIVLSPFSMAVLLSLGRISRYSQKVTHFLVSYISDYYISKEKCRSSIWLKNVLDEGMPLHVNVQKVIKKVLSYTRKGWDHIIPSLVELGFKLIDRKSSSILPRRRSKTLTPVVKLLSFELNVEDRETFPSSINTVWQGAEILRCLFLHHKVVRKELIEQILFRIISGENPAASLEILRGIASEDLLSFLDFLQNIKDTLDYISFMQPEVAVRFIQILKPLLFHKKDLKDYVIMVLRKCMFKHELNIRLVATKGFLTLFETASGETFALSQGSQSTTASNSEDHEFFLQALSIIRRCLSQQPEIRVEMYAGLTRLFLKHEELQSFILDLLKPQLLRYFEQDTSCPRPLRLENCVTATGELGEPVAQLLLAIFTCLCDSTSKLKKITPSYQLVKTAVKSIAKRVLQLKIEDYDFITPRSADPSDVEKKKIGTQIDILRGVTESCMEYCVHKASSNGEEIGLTGLGWVQKLVALENKLRDFKEIKPSKKLKKPSAKPKKRRYTRLAPLLTSGATTRLLNLLSLPENSEIRERMNETEGSAGSRQSNGLEYYILTTANLHLEQKRKAFTSVSDNEDIKKFCLSVASEIPKIIHRKVKGIRKDSEDRRGDTTEAAQAILLFRQCLQISLDVSREFCRGLLVRCNQALVEPPLEESKASRNCLRRMELYFSELLAKQCFHEALRMLDVIKILGRYLRPEPGSEEAYSTHAAWIKKMCTEKDVTYASLARGMMDYLVEVSNDPKESLHTILEASQDLATLYGDIAQENGPSRSTFYAFINDSTHPAVISSVLDYVDGELKEVEWVLKQLISAEVQAPKESQELERNLTNVKKLIARNQAYEDIIFLRLVDMSAVLSRFMSVRVQVEDEKLLKALTLMYKLVTASAKILIRTKTKPSSKFRKLIQVTGKELTVQVYPFILYLQQEEGKNETNAKIAREARIIPNLIFQLEQYEQYVIKLAKASKTDLTKWMKHTTNRDFRIVGLEDLERKKEEEEKAKLERKKKRKKDTKGKVRAKKRSSRGKGKGPRTKNSLRRQDQEEGYEEVGDEENQDPNDDISSRKRQRSSGDEDTKVSESPEKRQKNQDTEEMEEASENET